MRITTLTASNQIPFPQFEPLGDTRFAPPAAVHTPMGSKLIRYENGIPTPYYGENIKTEDAKQTLIAAASLPYVPTTYEIENGLADEFEGMTNWAVACVKRARAAADGDLKSFESLSDRWFGKPKQSVEAVSMSMNYQEFLQYLVEKEQAGESIIDVTPEQEQSSSPTQTTSTTIFNESAPLPTCMLTDEELLADL